MRGGSLDDALATVAPIVTDVRTRGDAALLEWTAKFDGPRPDGLRVPPDRIERAAVADDVLEALRGMIAAVRKFSVAQLPSDTTIEAAKGITTERRWIPLASAGLCVPSGTFPLPSSLVMTAVPAQVAGVARLAVVTPNPVDATLVAARLLGIDEVYAIGGAQAVAAMAYGTETIAAVDVIVGPGNRFVTAAKLLVSTRCRIDLPAGPSEVVVIADASADPEACVADLLAQAEHGPDSEAILVSDAAELVDAVSVSVADAPNVRCVLVETLEQALLWSEAFAPEHLELHVTSPEELVPRVRNAGSVFVGGSAAVGDYAAGATHVLPTGGLARSCGGLGVEMFLKPLQVVHVSDQGAREAAAIVGPLARAEGLPLHAAAAERGVAA